jgi:leucyl aminopeptidase
MLVPTIDSRPLNLKSVIETDVIAIGFCKTEIGKYIFPVASSLVRKIEVHFGVQFSDELDFFSGSGKSGEIFELSVRAEGTRCKRLILVGLGNQSQRDARTAGAALGRKLRGKEVSLFSIAATSKLDIRAHAIALVLGSYQWNQKSGIEKGDTAAFTVADTYPEEVVSANILARAVWRARDLIHMPANIKTPKWMADQAKNLTKNKDFSLKILVGKDLQFFGGLRAVGNSSPNPGPRFVEIAYAPAGSETWPHVVLVGKGITFDTGGVSLKRPYELMVGMKSDMAGAAAVLAVISAMPEVKPKVRVTALLMLAENALSRTAQRPSDVIRQYGGTTVEVINTDAEGRLVLADGLAYADLTLNPDYLIDMATLTGAASLGLGRQYAAMYTRSPALAKNFFELGEKSGDRVWHMPLIDDYQISLQSSIADLNHMASKHKFSAGSVTAALFLEHFAGKRSWVHFDIAGPARSESDSGENPKGGTGFGVRLLIDWIGGLK